MKCGICNKDIEETFLGKFRGTIVNIKKGGKNEVYHACPSCQRQFGGKLKEELSKK